MGIQRVDLQRGFAVFTKRSYRTEMHRHYGIEIIFCKKSTFAIGTERGTYFGLKSAIIPSNLPHNISCGKTSCQLLFIDPLSALGQYFAIRYRLKNCKKVLVNLPEISCFSQDFNILEKEYPRKIVDERIDACLQEIHQKLSFSRLSVKHLSQVSYLSESRLSHLFKEQIGISIRQYILWNKIRLAVAKSAEGQSLTSAAHLAGFTDSAHFSRTFSMMFGSTPSFALQD